RTAAPRTWRKSSIWHSGLPREAGGRCVRRGGGGCRGLRGLRGSAGSGSIRAIRLILGLVPQSSSLTGVDLELRCGRVSSRNVLPIPYLPHGLEKFCFSILVLQVISMLPRVNYHQRNAGLGEVGLVVVNLGN